MEEWEATTLAETLRRRPERKPEFKTASGIPVKRLYTPLDVAGLDYLRDLGFPGQYPFTRGVYATMYRGRIWTMRQYAGYGTAEETNKRFKYLLKQGQTGLSVAFDFPTQLGYDPDHPMAAGEVGKVGVSVFSVEEMMRLFNGIPLGQVTTSMTINATTNAILAMYIATAEAQGYEQAQLGGTVQNDILKEYVARAMYIFPPEPSMRLAVDIIEYCAKHMPRWNPISISGYHIREAGANAVQELAFTLANAIAYVEGALERGLNVDDFAPRLSFFFAAHNDFFEEIAKFRAARRMWARIMKERFGAKKPRSCALRFHTQTAGSTLTAQQPLVNIVRVAIQALAAVLGGTQSLHTNSFDEALCLPSEEAVLIALRTQQVIAYESGVTRTVDPLAGSYYVEWLTNEIEERAWRYIERIDRMGGAVKAIEEGYMQKEIARSAYEQQKAIEEGELVVVGVNRFRLEGEEVKVELLKVDPAVEEEQKRRLRELRARRDNRKVEDALDALRRASEGEENLMPYVLRAVKAKATIGEIFGVLREVFGEYKPPLIF
ncbi:MAG TPA: methylmalonyl-CoA mutase [Candidatus Bathyarchaeota archaeon]|nr:methylmalonyl-CoA mutase [Candidatus Bathyarchaeota archaeon]